MFRRWQSIMRIALGLVGLTASLLLAAQLLGLMPDEAGAQRESRRKFAESLAVQVSAQASHLSQDTLLALLNAVVSRNEDILSAAFRDGGGTIFAVAGDHAANWNPPTAEQSTPDDIQVPILNGDIEVGRVELAYTPIPGAGNWNPLNNSVLMLVLFVSAAGFVGYFLVLRRSLRALDPNAVIPERVRAALDALVEGVVILDEQETIVLANKSFAHRIGISSEELLGQDISGLNWRNVQTGGAAADLPWRLAMQTGVPQAAIPLSLRSAAGDIRHYMVNGTPIIEGGDSVRGVLATFDDVTDLEKRHSELQRALSRLKESQDKIERQNVELRFLATRDPLTQCLNRRAFFEQFEEIFSNAARHGQPLSCAMIDIDHFKSINDRFGHSVGDKVIAFVADVLRDGTQADHLVCRYGGEEFCLVLPGISNEQAFAIIDKIRLRIATDSRNCFAARVNVTASAGVASLPGDAAEAAALVNQADTALYSAKQSGRNRTISWLPGDEEISEALATSPGASARPDESGNTTVIRRLEDRISELEESIPETGGSGEQGLVVDKITGLPGGEEFAQRVDQVLAQAQRRQTMAAILYVDIGLYQRVQESLGPAAGNDLLKIMADRLSALLRRSDTLAMLGDHAKLSACSRITGDDFAIILDDLTHVESVTWIIQRIFEALAAPLQISGHEVFVTGAIGASLYPDDGETTDALLVKASAARRHARTRLGPNSYAFYEEKISKQSYAQIQMEKDLRHAIDRGEFMLHYQPKISLANGELTGVEALIRWDHPERGLVNPAEFIPLAEQTGLVNVIGDWVIRKACRQAMSWRRIGLEPGRVAVNLSPIQLRCESIVGRLDEILKTTGMEPRFLELEVTESILMEDMARASDILRKLRALGVHIALDDFGTGYSSLSCLRQLPIDTVKIDGSFIQNILDSSDGSTLVSSMIAMAHQLGMRVVAEAVEKREQLLALRNLRCDEVQGFLISYPLPVGQLAELLRNDKPWRFMMDESRRDTASFAPPMAGKHSDTGKVVAMPKVGA